MLTLRGTAGRGGLWLPPDTAGGHGQAPTEQQRSQVRPQGDASMARHSSSRDRAGPWRGTASPRAAGHQEPGCTARQEGQGTARRAGGWGQAGSSAAGRGNRAQALQVLGVAVPSLAQWAQGSGSAAPAEVGWFQAFFPFADNQFNAKA